MLFKRVYFNFQRIFSNSRTFSLFCIENGLKRVYLVSQKSRTTKLLQNEKQYYEINNKEHLRGSFYTLALWVADMCLTLTSQLSLSAL